VLGDAPLSYSDVPKFEFTTQVIMEALRLYPAVLMVDRMAVADDRVGDVAIPRGSMVICVCVRCASCPALLAKSGKFRYGAFHQSNEKLRTPFTFLPFGAGPRGCIGGNYAMLQILMILRDLLKTYDFQLAPGQTIEARPMVILRPKHGIRMMFTKNHRACPVHRISAIRAETEVVSAEPVTSAFRGSNSGAFALRTQVALFAVHKEDRFAMWRCQSGLFASFQAGSIRASLCNAPKLREPVDSEFAHPSCQTACCSVFLTALSEMSGLTQFLIR